MSTPNAEELARQQFHTVKRGLTNAIDRCGSPEELVILVEAIAADPKAALKDYVDKEISDISDSVKGLNNRKSELTAAKDSVDSWDW